MTKSQRIALAALRKEMIFEAEACGWLFESGLMEDWAKTIKKILGGKRVVTKLRNIRHR
jgi:hypothetical protein